MIDNLSGSPASLTVVRGSPALGAGGQGRLRHVDYRPALAPGNDGARYDVDDLHAAKGMIQVKSQAPRRARRGRIA